MSINLDTAFLKCDRWLRMTVRCSGSRINANKSSVEVHIGVSEMNPKMSNVGL